MRSSEVAELLEPPGREARQHGALVGDGLVEDHVERREAVGGDEQEVAVVDLVRLADFPAVDEGQALDVGGCHGHGRSLLIPSSASSSSTLYWSGGRRSRRRATVSTRSRIERMTRISTVPTAATK